LATQEKFLSGSPLSTQKQLAAEDRRVAYFQDGLGTVSEKLTSLSRFMSRQYLAKTLAYTQLVKESSGILGSILECGVYFGNGLMTYANLLSALEPYNYQCKVIGFDTFSGDVGLSRHDNKGEDHFKRKDGDYRAESYEDLLKAIEIYDEDRPLNHLKKIELVKGDLRETSKLYVSQHPQLVARILHLSVNLYEPTKAALQAFLPRVPRGGFVVIHGMNYTAGGATEALFEEIKSFSNKDLKTFEFYPNMSFLKIN